jgi:DNA polymerase III gamma/tau subunit
MSAQAQLAFLSLLDATAFPPSTCFIFTANDTTRLQDRFLSRCQVLDFSSHGLSTPIAELLAKVWEKEAPGTPAPNFSRIAKDSTNNVRTALLSLQTELLAV